MPHVRSSVDRAGCWFLQSGIQDDTGGVARYYHSDTARNARVSTEITGYAISTLVYLYRIKQDTALLNAAERAGKFLQQSAWNPELATFPFEFSANGDAPQPLSYFFDIGIIIRGLIHLWRATQDEQILEVAVRAGESMGRDFAAEHLFHPILQLPGKQPLAHERQWSRSPGCYQLKSALAWHDLHEVTDRDQFLEWYEAALTASIEASDEFLPAETPEKTMDRLHAYAYFLEGLLPRASRSDVRRVLAEGVARLSTSLREIEPVFVRSDVYAQLLRARLFAAQLAGVDLNVSEAEHEAKCISEFQLESPDPRICGGYCFGRKSGSLLPFVNPVSTAFCLQALKMWNDFQNGKTLDRESLI